MKIRQATHFLGNPAYVLAAVLFLSLAALGAALIAQYTFGLHPCRLCIYQRYPFVLSAGVAVTGLCFPPHLRKAKRMALLLCAFLFLANAALAFHHTGVEQGWWESVSASCAVQNLNVNSEEELLQALIDAPLVRCDEAAWTDPLLGLSMAAYNFILCAGLFLFCVAAAFSRTKIREN